MSDDLEQATLVCDACGWNRKVDFMKLEKCYRMRCPECQAVVIDTFDYILIKIIKLLTKVGFASLEKGQGNTRLNSADMKGDIDPVAEEILKINDYLNGKLSHDEAGPIITIAINERWMKISNYDKMLDDVQEILPMLKHYKLGRMWADYEKQVIHFMRAE